MTPDDFGATDKVGVAVGESAADGFGCAPLNLKAGIGFFCGMAAPGEGEVCHETVVVKGVGDDGTGGNARIFQAGRPSFRERVGVDLRCGRHHAKAGLARSGHPPAVLDDGKAKCPARFVIGTKVVVGGDGSFFLFLHPGLGVLELFRARWTKKHRNGQAVVLDGRNHGEGDVPGIVANVAEHGQTSTDFIGGVKIGGDGPLPKVGEAIGFFRLSFGFGERGQKEAGEDRNDCDDDEQLNQGEGLAEGIGSLAGRLGLRRADGDHASWLA